MHHNKSNVSRLNNRLFQAISHILEVSQELRKTSPEGHDDERVVPIEAGATPGHSGPDFDVFSCLTEDESAELVNVESLRQALYHHARIVEGIKASIIKQARSRLRGGPGHVD